MDIIKKKKCISDYLSEKRIFLKTVNSIVKSDFNNWINFLNKLINVMCISNIFHVQYNRIQ